MSSDSTSSASSSARSRFFDQPLGLLEDAEFFVQAAKASEADGILFLAVEIAALHELPLLGTRSLPSKRHHQRRPQCEGVLAGDHLVVVVAAPVFQVVENLKADANVPTERTDQRFVLLDRASHAESGVQRGLEGGGRLESVDLQSIQRREIEGWVLLPEHFGPLAIAELDVRGGHPFENVAGDIVG